MVSSRNSPKWKRSTCSGLPVLCAQRGVWCTRSACSGRGAPRNACCARPSVTAQHRAQHMRTGARARAHTHRMCATVMPPGGTCRSSVPRGSLSSSSTWMSCCRGTCCQGAAPGVAAFAFVFECSRGAWWQSQRQQHCWPAHGLATRRTHTLAAACSATHHAEQVRQLLRLVADDGRDPAALHIRLEDGQVHKRVGVGTAGRGGRRPQAWHGGVRVRGTCSDVHC